MMDNNIIGVLIIIIRMENIWKLLDSINGV